MSELLLVFDTETTGLNLHPNADVSKQPKMIEFGGTLLNLDDGSVEEEFEWLVDPREPLQAVITKITGLTDERLKGAPTFMEALPQLERVFASAKAVVAHNLPFDKAIIHGELARNNLTTFPWPGREFCTVGLYQDRWGRNVKLSDLYEAVVGKKLEQEHRGLADAMALVEIIQKDALWRYMK